MASQLTEIEWEIEFRRCAHDVEYFIEKYWHISHPNPDKGGFMLMALRDSQKIILDAWQKNVKTVSLKARQIGWTTLSAAYAFHTIFFTAGRNVINLSRTQELARHMLRMCVIGYEMLPEQMKKRGPARTSKSVDRLEFDNKSKIESLPSKSDPARGKTAALMIIDEWAFFEDPENAWAAIEAATDIGGRVIIISTANGAGNYFFSFYFAAKEGTNGFKSLFFPWNSIPERDEEWYERKARELPEWQLHQEYPRNDVEAFTKSGRPAFDSDALIAMKLESKPEAHFDIGKPAITAEGAVAWIEALNGGTYVYEWPRADCTYVIGADVSEGGKKSDFQSSAVINMNHLSVVAEIHTRIEPDLYAEILHALGMMYNKALIGVERNAMGGVVLTELRKHLKYPNIYFERKGYEEGKVKKTAKMGWYTSAKTKPFIVNDLAEVIRDFDIEIPCQETIDELIAYRQTETGGWGGEPHDDRVMAVGIALQMTKYAKIREIDSTDAMSDLTVDQFMRLMGNARRESNGNNIGSDMRRMSATR